MNARPAVLVTGGAKRIGEAIATAFGKAGWHVVIHHGNSCDDAKTLADTLPSAETCRCDLNDWQACASMVDDLAARLEDWRVLINCAGIFPLDTASLLDPDTFESALRINAGSPARLAQLFLAKATASGGRRVIQVTDQKIENPNPDFFSYTMSKHALAATIPMLTMAAQKPEDRIYGLAPGAILASHDQSVSETELSHRMNLLHRKTGADEVADAALFLAEGWLASGSSLYIDSGQHLVPQDRDVLFLARGQ